MNAEQEGLAAVLRAQQAAVYLYGVIDAYAAAGRRAAVADFTAAHRTERDAADAAYAATGTPAPTAPAGFSPKDPITDAASAANAAVTVEEDCAQAYRELVAKATQDGVRRLGVDGLTACALRAAR